MRILYLLAVAGLISSRAEATGIAAQLALRSADRPVESAVVYYLDGDLRYDTPPGSSISRLIYLDAIRTLVLVDDRARSYVVLDSATIAALKTKVTALRAQLVAALPQLPPAERAEAEAALAALPPVGMRPSADAGRVHPTEGFEEVAGRRSRRLEVRRAGKVIGMVWVADWDDAGAPPEIAAAAGRLATLLADLFASLGPTLAMSADDTDLELLRILAELDGFPVRLQALEAGVVREEFELRELEQRTLAPAHFAPPASYQRRSLGTARR